MRLLTNDLYEGAWLLSQGMELANLWIDGNGKRSIVFEFIGDRLEGLKEEYKKGRAQANVVRLKVALRELKDKMYGLLREKNLPNDPPRLEHLSGQVLRKGGNHVYQTIGERGRRD